MQDVRGFVIAGLAVLAAAVFFTQVVFPRKGDHRQEASAAPDQAASGEQSKWRTIEADNGTIYKVDTTSVFRFTNGNVEIVFYVDEGAGMSPLSGRRYLFDCKGHYQDEMNLEAGTMTAPPRSVAGELQRIACGQ